MSYRVGIGFDAHRLAPGRPLVLGGVRVPFDRGLEGHSDGDVLLHALTDAVLGAVGGPDIGSLFPSDDERYRGLASRRFVERAVALADERGFRVVQLDAVVVAEAPRLATHLDAMRATIATLLGLAVERVGLKATTTDGLGFAGRGEGIAAQVVVLVESRDARG